MFIEFPQINKEISHLISSKTQFSLAYDANFKVDYSFLWIQKIKIIGSKYNYFMLNSKESVVVQKQIAQNSINKQKSTQMQKIDAILSDLSPYITNNVANISMIFSRGSMTDMKIIETPAATHTKTSYFEQIDEGIKSISKVISWTNLNDNGDSNEYSGDMLEVSEYQSSQNNDMYMSRDIQVKNGLLESINQEQNSIEYQNKIFLTKDYSKRYYEKNLKIANNVGKQLKKGCNCKKTQCLKLYCDCFRENKKCQGCSCVGCHNLQEFSQQRNNAMAILVDRNPQVFKPKIQSQTHTKGCNCKKSNCSKKYCQCYQAGLKCGQMCKCQDCKNCTKDNRTIKSIKRYMLPMPIDFKLKNEFGPPIIVPNSNVSKNNLKN